MKYLIYVILFLVSCSAFAGVYKCQVNGQIVYQQMPCADAGTEMNINTDTPTVIGNDLSVKDKACSRKTQCGQMRDCKDAEWYFDFCGQSDLDADNDGIPCEELCLKKPVAKGKKKLPHEAQYKVNRIRRFLNSSFGGTRADAKRRICAIYREHGVEPPGFC